MQTIKLDIAQKNNVPLLYVKQRDVGHKFAIELYENGKIYTVDENYTCAVWYSGESGEGNYTHIGEKVACEIEGNKITVEMMVQMLNEPGGHEMCVVVYDPYNKQKGFWNIPYFVEAIPGADSEAATAYYNAFLDAQKKAEEAADRAEAAADRAESAGGGVGGGTVIVALDEGNAATHTALEIYDAIQNEQTVVFHHTGRLIDEFVPLKISKPDLAVFSKAGYPTEFDIFDIEINNSGTINYNTHFSSSLVNQAVEKVGTDLAPVSYLPQTLTEEQKAQARENIGASGVGEGSGGTDVDIVQTTGDSETAVMSQKAVTDVFMSAFAKLVSVPFDGVEKGKCYSKNSQAGANIAAYDTYYKAVTPRERFFVTSKLVPSASYSAASFWDENHKWVADGGEYSIVGGYVADYEVEVPANAVLMRVVTFSDVVPEVKANALSPFNLHGLATGKYFVKFGGNECYIKTRYNNSEDIVIKLAKPTTRGNGLPDFDRVYTVARSEPMSDSLSEIRNIFTATTDMFFPHVVAAVNNIDGDTPDNTYFTGGNHRSDNSGTGGTPTAECVSWKVYADGKELTNEAVYADTLSMCWTNMIQAYNTTKADGTGRAVMQEDIRLSFEGLKINVEVTHTALEELKRTYYYGIGAVKGNFTKMFFAGSKVKRAELAISAADRIDCGDKNCRDIILSTENDDKMCVHIDSIDLGDLAKSIREYSAFNSNGKCYFSVIEEIPNNALAQQQGEKTTLRGYYEFYVQ